MIEFKVNDIMYVKKECLDDYLPSGFSQYYKGTFYDPCTEKTYPGNACRVREWKISTGPGEEDPVSVKVEMLYDNQVWEFPSRALYQKKDETRNLPKLPKIKLDISRKDLISCYADCASYANNFITKVYKPQEEGDMNSYYVPKRIIYNDPATIVFWKDGTKTVVKKAAKEPYNKYNAFCAALAKKVYGNNSRVNAFVASGEDQAKKKKKDSASKFVRDEKGRWVSKSIAGKGGKKK
jgi:hypothetical protein